MTSAKNGKLRVFFNESADHYFRLRNMGYYDFRIVEPFRLSRVYNWNSIHYVSRGKGFLFIRGKKYVLNEGDFFFIPKHEATVYYSDEEHPWSYYWISFSAASLFNASEVFNLDYDNPVCSAKCPSETKAIFEELFSCQFSGLKLYYLTIAALNHILALDFSQSDSTVKKALPKEKITTNIKQIIELNLSHPDFAIKHIAELLYISQRHMDRIFKSETGMTPREYLTRSRLNHAVKLLHQKKYTIKTLCRECGFNDESHFMRSFKAAFGMTVKEYRKAIEKN